MMSDTWFDSFDFKEWCTVTQNEQLKNADTSAVKPNWSMGKKGVWCIHSCFKLVSLFCASEDCRCWS